ncbi:RecQ family ATP-dependent DNA helicase [Xylanibacter muris]|uniref:ATP-dependent DNA helicase RecQ n=1 Tax=Xylanibacter muris TaxID=2736290 RepID=A0ABX2AMC5_9BACT|nr:ATP-dependent DNA helicase RecQ [Xylanibacter muris]NPD92386.1 RecQ family ATP-dependent DNA helicase [Xylanibacter muris]
MADKYSEILKRYWGYDCFRGIQREIIESICRGDDTLGLMPTGGGKSIAFQVPALAMDGACIVVTPLIALMKDQVDNLRRRGVRAAAIYSGMTHSEIITTLENAVFGAVKILYVSPERLSTDLFQAKLRHTKVSFICVDEAHCISQWGYDFRPSYLRIAQIRRLLPGKPVLALTATATGEVVADIQKRLGFRRENVFKMSFERKNLAYVVRYTEDKMSEMIHILSAVEGCAIVYARNRNHTKDVSKVLCNNGIDATYYHAGLEDAVKDRRQKEWQTGKVRVIVATNAFGMGIDKPDVRTVIHMDCPDSIEAYFQEAGRAGRDGKKAYAVLLYDKYDTNRLKTSLCVSFPEKEYVRQVYDHIAYFYQIGVGSGAGLSFEFNMDKFCRIYRHFQTRAESALKILTRAGYIEYRDNEDHKSRVMFILERDGLYRLKNNTVEEDSVIEALLRNYTGLFVEYQLIEEAVLAMNTGMSQNEIYNILKGLNRKHIIRYVPRSTTPTLRYTQNREDSQYIHIGREVYEDLKAAAGRRIEAVISYAENDTVCRSSQLLEYFGEETAHSCGLCDVCLAETGKEQDVRKISEAKEQIIRILGDGKRHVASDLEIMSFSNAVCDAALDELLNENFIKTDNGFIMLSHTDNKRLER